MKKDKIFLFSGNNNIIVEATIDKIYIKNTKIPTEYYEADNSQDTAISSMQYGKIVYVRNEDFEDMLMGNRKNRSWRIFKVISIGHKNDNKFFIKLKNILKRKK